MLKRIDKIMTIIMMLLIIVFSIIVGANEKGFRLMPVLVFLSIEIIYLLILKIKYKQKIFINNKIDLLVLLFFLSTLLPLIFRTYSSFQGTIEFIFNYFFIYSTYICFRNNIKNDKQIKLILNTILFTSLIIFIISVDMIKLNLFESLYRKINIDYVNIKHLSGGFGYKNTYSIFYMICIYISLYLFNNSKNIIKKIIYVLFIIFSFILIALSQSRLVLLLTIISLIIYFAIDNKKVLKKYYKKIIVYLFILILVTTSIFYIFCNKNDNLIFKGKREFLINYSFKKDKKYEFTIYSNSKNNFHITFEDANKDFTKSKIDLTTDFKKVSKDKYKFTFNYKPRKDLYRVKMFLISDNKVSISKLLINNKDYILKYKYIPYKINNYLSSFSFKDYSLYQRLIYYKDSIKIFIKSPLIGQGGNTWKVESRAVQDIKYNVKETHSYLFELLISYGLIGLILFTILFIYFNYLIFKNKNKNILPFVFAFDTLFIHSYFFDFDMSFIFIELLFYILLALIINDLKINNYKKEKYIKLDNKLIIILFIIICILSLELLNRKYNNSLFDKDYKKLKIINSIKTKEDPKNIVKSIKKYIKNEPYNDQLELYSYYLNLLYDNRKIFNEDELLDNILFINKNYNKYEYSIKYDYSSNYKKSKLFLRFYLYYKNQKYKNKNIKIELSKLKKSVLNRIDYDINLIKKDIDLDENKRKELLDNYDKLLNESK